MKRLLFVIVVGVLACGKDVTAPANGDQCLQAKKDFIAQHFGASYTPSPELLEQSQFNLGGTSKAVFSVVNGACVVTVT